MKRLVIAVAALALLGAACTRASEGESGPSPSGPDGPAAAGPNGAAEPGSAEGESFAGTVAAPEFPEGLDWLNTGGRPLTIGDLRGKVVILDFWTYGCINCIHVIPDLKQLEAEYPDELVVIGVHSAKFDNESATENIRQMILRYDLEHAVVNDRNFETWQLWGATAWPTTAVIDPAGNVVGIRSGEGVYDVVQPVIESLVAEFDARGEIDRTPLALRLESEGLPETLLSFPGKVEVAPDETVAYIADTNHHRIVAAALPDGQVLAVYGSGEAGLRNGNSLEARFRSPQGMELSPDRSTLYVADTGNHTIRSIDLADGEVTTLLGTGAPGGYPPTGGLAPDIPLRSPWDLALNGDTLYIAMAGSHQIWSMDLATGLAGAFAGDGGESDRDGSAGQAQLAQPSGLAFDGGDRIYFADSESSSIRWVNTRYNTVDTLVGAENGLFDFGDVDGVGTEVRLQHPLGVAWAGDRLFVADTYNSKIKVVEPEAQSAVTFLGEDSGWRDGADALFYEPGGIDFAGSHLYVADTNNHVVRIVDVETKEATTLVLKGLEAFQPGGDGEYRGTVFELPAFRVSPGAGTIVLALTLPPGHKVNEEAPSSVEWLIDGAVVTLNAATADLTGTEFPVMFPATFTPGQGRLTADLNLVWCADDAESLCFIERARIGGDLEVADGGGDEVVIDYEIELPDPAD